MLEHMNLVLVGTGAVPGDQWMGNWWGHPTTYWGMGLHGIIGLSLAVLAVVILVFLVRAALGGRGRTGSTASLILDTRYAQGEIDRDAYLERKRDLS